MERRDMVMSRYGDNEHIFEEGDGAYELVIFENGVEIHRGIFSYEEIKSEIAAVAIKDGAEYEVEVDGHSYEY